MALLTAIRLLALTAIALLLAQTVRADHHAPWLDKRDGIGVAFCTEFRTRPRPEHLRPVTLEGIPGQWVNLRTFYGLDHDLWIMFATAQVYCYAHDDVWGYTTESVELRRKVQDCHHHILCNALHLAGGTDPLCDPEAPRPAHCTR